MAAQQLPNLTLIGQALDTFKAEVVKVENLPTWNEGTTIITRLDQLLTRMDQIETRMDQRFEQVDQRFEQVHQHLTTMNASIQTLSERLNATQHNTTAQFANYTAHGDNSSLVPLHHYITNRDIDGFPATTGDIGLLNRQMVDTIIEALGGSTEGTLDKKRLRLRRLVGVVRFPSA